MKAKKYFSNLAVENILAEPMSKITPRSHTAYLHPPTNVLQILKLDTGYGFRNNLVGLDVYSQGKWILCFTCPHGKSLQLGKLLLTAFIFL